MEEVTQSTANATVTASVTESSAQIPTVNERLGHLRPSRELLEYYRSKIAEFDSEYDALVGKLDRYKQTCVNQVSILC